MRRLKDLQQQTAAVAVSDTAPMNDTLEELALSLGKLQDAAAELKQSNLELTATCERTEAERSRYQMLFDFAPEAYLVTDAKGVIQEANITALRLLNRGRRFLQGEPFFLYVGAPDRQTCQLTLNQLQAGELTQVENWEVQVQPRALAAFPAMVTLTARHDAEGRLENIYWQIRNITTRKQIENTLRYDAQRLEILHELDAAILNAEPPAAMAEIAIQLLLKLEPAAFACALTFDFERQEATVLASHMDGETPLRAGSSCP